MLPGEQAAALGRRLAAWRAMHGVPSWRLAADLSVSRAWLSKLEHGRGMASQAAAERICAWTGLPLDGDGVSPSMRGGWHDAQLR
jgi:transcriptional regulator with XRE-family HTH domain